MLGCRLCAFLGHSMTHGHVQSEPCAVRQRRTVYALHCMCQLHDPWASPPLMGGKVIPVLITDMCCCPGQNGQPVEAAAEAGGAAACRCRG